MELLQVLMEHQQLQEQVVVEVQECSSYWWTTRTWRWRNRRNILDNQVQQEQLILVEVVVLVAGEGNTSGGCWWLWNRNHKIQIPIII
jgi:hypothetical protein